MSNVKEKPNALSVIHANGRLLAAYATRKKFVCLGCHLYLPITIPSYQRLTSAWIGLGIPAVAYFGVRVTFPGRARGLIEFFFYHFKDKQKHTHQKGDGQS